MIGGETAEMPGMYAGGDYDLAGFTVGAVEREKIITGENISEGDVILGLASDGVHSNGFSLVRKILNNDFSDRARCEELLTPTRLYVKPILEALQIETQDGKPAIKGMAHITGGGLLENIPRVLPESLSANLDAASWPLPPLFQWLLEAGNLSSDDMARTLNCGIGFVVICSAEHQDAITASLESSGETVYEIGTITPRTDKNSDAEPITIDHMDAQWVKN